MQYHQDSIQLCIMAEILLEDLYQMIILILLEEHDNAIIVRGTLFNYLRTEFNSYPSYMSITWVEEVNA